MVKMPDPMTAPMPSEVKLSHPRDFFNRTSAFSESDMSWSIPLQRKSSDPTHALRSRPGKPEAQNYTLYISGMDAPQCNPRRPFTQPAWAPVYACSSCAYRSINFFVPRPGKLSDTRRSSLSPSTPTIVPTPKLGWRTLRPSMGLESPLRFAAVRPKEVWAGWRRGAAVACLGPPRTRHRNSSGEYEYSRSGS